MRLAVLSESAADEVAVRILVDGLLGQPSQPVAPPPLRTRGWPAVLHVLPNVLRSLHYHTDVEALVLVVDANHSPLHQRTHEEPGQAHSQCRFCQLRAQALQTQERLRAVPGREPVKLAMGVAMPAIEAWYRCGVDPHASEAFWMQNLQATSHTAIKNRLKREVYGTERPSLALETQRAEQEARRLVQSLSTLETLFPNGFGALAYTVQGWLAG